VNDREAEAINDKETEADEDKAGDGCQAKVADEGEEDTFGQRASSPMFDTSSDHGWRTDSLTRFWKSEYSAVRKSGHNDDIGSECLFLSSRAFPSTHESSAICSMQTIYSSTYDVHISI
jgi:hypothetical protein